MWKRSEAHCCAADPAVLGTLGRRGRGKARKDNGLNPTHRADTATGLVDRLDASTLGLCTSTGTIKLHTRKGTLSLSRPDSWKHKIRDSPCSHIELDRDRVRCNGLQQRLIVVI